MLQLNADNEAPLHVNKCIRVLLHAKGGTWDNGVFVRVEDVDGTDISDSVRSFTLTRLFPSSDYATFFDCATLELDMPGFDGPFCTPAVDFLEPEF